MAVAEVSSCFASCNQTWNLLRKDWERIGLTQKFSWGLATLPTSLSYQILADNFCVECETADSALVWGGDVPYTSVSSTDLLRPYRRLPDLSLCILRRGIVRQKCANFFARIQRLKEYRPLPTVFCCVAHLALLKFSAFLWKSRQEGELPVWFLV